MGTATPPPLSPMIKGTFAFNATSDRMPVILGKMVDGINSLENEIFEAHGKEGTNQLKEISERLQTLKEDVEQNRPFIQLRDNNPDVDVWNQHLKEYIEREGSSPAWYSPVTWLYSECYMYRRIMEAIYLSPLECNIDPFRDQKRNTYHGSQNGIRTLLSHLKTILDSPCNGKEIEERFMKLIQVQLWGNKVDMSLSIGQVTTEESNPIKQIAELKKNILVNDSAATWKAIARTDNKRIDIVLDNSGFEFMCDLVMAEFLLSTPYADKIYFHGKAMPWFMSDVTRHDLEWTLETMTNSDNPLLSYFGKKWHERFEDGSFVFTEDIFWSFPHDYSEMKRVRPDLYKELSKSKFIFFKGDLNYRKLIGDKHWDFTTDFDTSLCGFNPAPLVALRLIKVDSVVGLKPGQAEMCKAQNEDWMAIGEWAVIEFSSLVS